MIPEDKSRVDKLDDSLYSRTKYRNPLDQRSSVEAPAPQAPQAAEAWGGSDLNALLTKERTPVGATTIVKKVFIFAILFFSATLVVAGFVFLGGNNFISSIWKLIIDKNN